MNSLAIVTGAGGLVAAGLAVGVEAQPAVEWVFALVVVALAMWLTAIALGVPVGRRAGR